jgi:hypothetical protein
MAWFSKKPDPISDRARALSVEIASLEAQIKSLDTRLQRQQAQPQLRSTTPSPVTNPSPVSAAPPPVQDPIFEEVALDRLKARGESPTSADHYNELGVRKYDLPALLQRIRKHFRGPATTNPKLVSYLAAGGIQGLRPLRYEKRVARNRFIALVIVLFVVLLGLIAAFVKGHR